MGVDFRQICTSDMRSRWSLGRRFSTIDVTHEACTIDVMDDALGIMSSCVFDVVGILLALELLIQALEPLLGPALLPEGVGELMVLCF